MTEQEKNLVILETKVNALHDRLDRVEEQTVADLKEIKNDIKDILGHQNRSKGWAAAMLLVGGLLGGLVTKLF